MFFNGNLKSQYMDKPVLYMYFYEFMYVHISFSQFKLCMSEQHRCFDYGTILRHISRISKCCFRTLAFVPVS